MTYYRAFEMPTCVYGSHRPPAIPRIHFSPPKGLVRAAQKESPHQSFEVDWCEQQQAFWAKPKPNGVRKVTGYAD